ncbi:hypothetical protein MCOR25_002281 [Pyricularia grisea]|nr:hypothetical protein MCOR25_002281 [Pyricularia grisea]
MTDCSNFEESNTEQESLCPSCARKEAVRVGLQPRPNNLDRRLRTQNGTSSCGSSTASRSTRSSNISNSTGSVVSRASTTPSEHDALEASMQAIIDLKVQESTKAFEAAGGMRSLTASSAAGLRPSSLASRQVDQKTTDSLPATLALAVEMTSARAIVVEITPARASTKADMAGAAIRGAFAPQFGGIPARTTATAPEKAPPALVVSAPPQVSENPRVTQYYYSPYKAPSVEKLTRTRDDDAISIMSTGPDFGNESSFTLQRNDSLFLPTDKTERKTGNEGYTGEVTISSPDEVLKPGAARKDDRDSLPSGRVVQPRRSNKPDAREQNPAPRIMPILLEPSSVANDYAKFCADIAVKREAQTKAYASGQRANAEEGCYKNYSLPSRGLAIPVAATTTVAAKTYTAETVQPRRVDAHIPLDKPLPRSPRNESGEAGDDKNPLPTRVRRSRATSDNGRSSGTPAVTLPPSTATRKARSQPGERSDQGFDDDETFFVPRRPRPTFIEGTPVTPQTVPVSLAIGGGKTLRRTKALPTRDGRPDGWE